MGIGTLAEQQKQTKQPVNISATQHVQQKRHAQQCGWQGRAALTTAAWSAAAAAAWTAAAAGTAFNANAWADAALTAAALAAASLTAAA